MRELSRRLVLPLFIILTSHHHSFEHSFGTRWLLTMSRSPRNRSSNFSKPPRSSRASRPAKVLRIPGG